MIVIGLTGRNASGKGEVADILRTRGFAYGSLSDALRAELEARGQAIQRDALIAIGRELRSRLGPDALARRVCGALADDRNHVVDSYRNPAEVRWSRENVPAFLLWEVSAPAELRFDRIRARGRESDPRTLDEFEALEAQEAVAADESGQDLDATGALADHRIENAGSREALDAAVDGALRAIPRIDRRRSWDEYFIEIARVVASRSNCLKRKVGAVVVKDRRIIATGYNGTPRGAKNCNEGGCPRCDRFAKSGHGLLDCVCSHAEENAIVQSACHGISVDGAVLYTTLSPCLQCTKMIINAGIGEVVYNRAYTLPDVALALLSECGIECRPYQ